MRRTAALIVGGGPAGAAAAIRLARAGAAPLLIERSPGPRDVVCGGFLGWDALAALAELGIDVQALGARPIERLRLIGGGRTVEARLPHRAAGLSRRCLDQALLARASEAGAEVLRGRAARSAQGCEVRLDDGEEIAAEALFLATGKHELRGLARPLEGRRERLSAGLRAALPARPELERALAGTIELHLFDQGYAGLLLQEDGKANFCLSVSQARLGQAGGIAPLIEALKGEAPRLAARLEGADLGWEAVAGVPYGWRAREGAPGLFRIGDQGAVIASLAGDGIAMALRSGISAAQAWLEGDTGWQARFSRQAALPIALAEGLRRAAESRAARGALMWAAKVPGLAGLAARLTRIG